MLWREVCTLYIHYFDNVHYDGTIVLRINIMSVLLFQSFLELKELDSSVLLNSSPAHSPLPFSVSGEIAKLEGVAPSWNREMGQSIVSGVSVSLSEVCFPLPPTMYGYSMLLFHIRKNLF